MEREVALYLEEQKKSGIYDEYQIKELLEGAKNGLSIEQIKLYAKTKINVYGKERAVFDSYQMKEIRLAFFRGFTFEEVETFAKKEYDYEMMQVAKAKIIEKKEKI